MMLRFLAGKLWPSTTKPMNVDFINTSMFNVERFNHNRLNMVSKLRFPNCIQLIGIMFFTCVSSASSNAAQSLLELYPNARTLLESKVTAEDYRLAIGPYKKVAGAWRLDKQLPLNGEIKRTTLELPERHTAKNGFEFYADQLKKQNATELFYCKARDCGTSNSWANNHFKVMQLYGLDQFQFYGAYEITRADLNKEYFSIYAVQRGNKRVYLHVEQIIVSQNVNSEDASR